jgi:cytochrome c-type biogenesis protein CcmH
MIVGNFMKSRRTFFSAVLAALLLGAVGVVSALAQTGMPTDDEVNAVASELYCPVCENVPLDVCPTQACAQWRDLIREKLAAGWNKEQIKNYFKDQYGIRVLAQPPLEGLNWLVYLLPPVFFALGAYLVYRALSHRKALVKTTVAVDVPAGGDPYLKRIEDELKQRK